MHLFKNDGFSSVFTQFKLAPFMRLWFCLLLYEIQPREYSIFCMLHVWWKFCYSNVLHNPLLKVKINLLVLVLSCMDLHVFSLLNSMVFNTYHLAIYSFQFIIISALYQKVWFWFAVQFQVAAKTLQNTASGKNYTSDKVSLSLFLEMLIVLIWLNC